MGRRRKGKKDKQSGREVGDRKVEDWREGRKRIDEGKLYCKKD